MMNHKPTTYALRIPRAPRIAGRPWDSGMVDEFAALPPGLPPHLVAMARRTGKPIRQASALAAAVRADVARQLARATTRAKLARAIAPVARQAVPR